MRTICVLLAVSLTGCGHPRECRPLDADGQKRLLLDPVRYIRARVERAGGDPARVFFGTGCCSILTADTKPSIKQVYGWYNSSTYVARVTWRTERAAVIPRRTVIFYDDCGKRLEVM